MTIKEHTLKPAGTPYMTHEELMKAMLKATAEATNMLNSMTINEITEDLKTCDDPVALSEYLTKLAGWASYYSEMMKKVQLVKPEKWLWIQTYATGLLDGKISTAKILNLTDSSKDIPMKRDKPLSDKKTDMTWFATEEGQKEIALKYEISRIEQMMSAIKRRLYSQKVDFKGLNNQI